jgi:hypothetical protein
VWIKGVKRQPQPYGVLSAFWRVAYHTPFLLSIVFHGIKADSRAKHHPKSRVLSKKKNRAKTLFEAFYMRCLLWQNMPSEKKKRPKPNLVRF